MAVYYVDNTRPDDSGDGLTEDTAWKTVAKVTSTTFVAGDIIQFNAGQIWQEELNVTDNGVLNNVVTFTAYGSGARPIFTDIKEVTDITDIGGGEWQGTGSAFRLQKNGTDLFLAIDETEWAMPETEFIQDGGTFRIKEDPAGNVYTMATTDIQATVSASSHLLFDGLEFQGATNVTASIINSNNIEMNNCDIGYLAHAGLRLDGSSAIVIDGCTLDTGLTLYYGTWSATGGSWRGNADGIETRNTLNDITIINNQFKNWQHGSIAFEDETLDGAVIMYNTTTSPDLSYGGRFVVNDDVTNLEMAYNKIINTSVNTQLGGHGNHYHHNLFVGTKSSPLKPGNIGAGIAINPYDINYEDNIYENNVFYDLDGPAISVEGWNTAPPYVQNNIFRNNIGYNCGKEPMYSADYAMVYVTTWDDSLNNTFENNLMYSENSTTPYYHQSVGSVNAEDFNLANGSNGDVISGNIDTYPNFVDLVHFMLGDTSPAIGTGLLPLATHDYAGNSIVDGGVGSGYDMGLYNQGFKGAIMTGMTEIGLGFSQAVLDDFRARALAQYV